MLTPARTPIDKLARSIRQTSIVKFFEFAERHFGDQHLKQLSVSQAGPNREITINGHSLVNFGFDSFLGLDHHPRVKAAVARGAQEWGTQFGASRAFAVCGAEVELEAKIAAWMGTEAAVIFPSVTLTNMGVLAGITAPQDVIVFDEYAHNSIQEGAKIAKANGVRVFSFSHNNPASLEQVLESAKPYRSAVIAIDGVYSMSGAIAPLVELNEIALRHDGVLFIDDAHATGVLGDRGRGVVFEALGTYDNTIVVGCMSKACSVFGAFVACSHQIARLIKMRSNTYVFGGPVPPPYLEAASTVIDIFCSEEYPTIRAQLDRNIAHLVGGLRRLDLAILGGHSPIITVLVGDEGDTFRAGKFLFDRGHYVQSVTVPAVPYHAAVLRIQINSNHQPAAIEALLEAMADLKQVIELPTAAALHERMAKSLAMASVG